MTVVRSSNYIKELIQCLESKRYKRMRTLLEEALRQEETSAEEILKSVKSGDLRRAQDLLEKVIDPGAEDSYPYTFLIDGEPYKSYAKVHHMWSSLWATSRLYKRDANDKLVYGVFLPKGSIIAHGLEFSLEEWVKDNYKSGSKSRVNQYGLWVGDQLVVPPTEDS